MRFLIFLLTLLTTIASGTLSNVLEFSTENSACQMVFFSDGTLSEVAKSNMSPRTLPFMLTQRQATLDKASSTMGVPDKYLALVGIRPAQRVRWVEVRYPPRDVSDNSLPNKSRISLSNGTMMMCVN